MKHYFFAISYQYGATFGTNNYGTVRKEFPSIDDLKRIVKEYNPLAKNIVLLSICELKEEDYKKLFPGYE